MEVFGNDFADVDVREELCYHSRPEKAKFGVVLNADKKSDITNHPFLFLLQLLTPTFKHQNCTNFFYHEKRITHLTKREKNAFLLPI